jgi:hypothetical protein
MKKYCRNWQKKMERDIKRERERERDTRTETKGGRERKKYGQTKNNSSPIL